MALVVGDFVKDTLSLKGFAFVTAVSEQGRNELTRIFAYSFDETSAIIMALVYKEDAARLLESLSTTNKIALAITDPLTLKAIQVKGEYLLHRDATESELALIKNDFRPHQNDIMMKWGMPDNIMDAWQYAPAIAIEISCKEIFDQTPRPNTGNKIS